jgi:hypothetical protein
MRAPVLFGCAIAFASLLSSSGPAARAASQTADFSVGPDEPVPGMPADRPIFEPHLAASPTNAAHLLGAAIVAAPAGAIGASQRCTSLLTFDAGRTWSTHTFDLQMCADPWVALGSDGGAWFGALGSLPPAAGHRLYVFHSPDGGRTWPDSPTDFGGSHDHPTLVVGDGESPSRDVAYVLSVHGAHVFVARSEDSGRTWLPPVEFTPSNLGFNTLAGGLLADGTLIVPFIDLQKPPFSDPANMLARRRVWAYRGQNLAADAPAPIFVSEDCAASTGFPSVVTIPQSSRALFGCVNLAGAVSVQASDSGLVWPSGVVVDAPPTGAFQRTPNLAATREGVVGTTWMDSRDVAAGCFILRGTVSTVGGTAAAITPGWRCRRTGASTRSGPTRAPGSRNCGLSHSEGRRFPMFGAHHG